MLEKHTRRAPGLIGSRYRRPLWQLPSFSCPLNCSHMFPCSLVPWSSPSFGPLLASSRMRVHWLHFNLLPGPSPGSWNIAAIALSVITCLPPSASPPLRHFLQLSMALFPLLHPACTPCANLVKRLSNVQPSSPLDVVSCLLSAFVTFVSKNPAECVLHSLA
jgi:hypothetical protein